MPDPRGPLGRLRMSRYDWFCIILAAMVFAGGIALAHTPIGNWRLP